MMVSGAEEILNSTNLFSRKPGIATTAEYLVSSKTSTGTHTCKQNPYNITCDCKGYRSKSACKHSLAIAMHVGIIEKHLDWLKKQPSSLMEGNKTVLLTKRKPGTGQKGGRPKSKSREKSPTSGKGADRVTKDDFDYEATFTKCYHNNEPFIIIKK